MIGAIDMKKLMLFICGMLLAIQVFGSEYQQNQELFPLPENLKPNVNFWTKVYSQYDGNQFILHDNENFDIIYEIHTIEDKNISEKRKWDEIEKVKKEYQKTLIELSQRQKLDVESLNDREKHVYQLFFPDQSAKAFAEAASRIRSQKGLKDEFIRSIARSGRYMDHILETFKKSNLPLELTMLPHVESSFNNKAYSKFGAAGIWQFTRGTGRLFMNINYSVDERFDPEKATEAAARLLKKNYEILGTWPLALTAYNHGVNGLKNAVRKLGTTDIGEIVENYESRQFKFASRNFYAEFLAALHVAQNYQTYFGDITLEKPPNYLQITIPYFMKLSALVDQLDISIEDVKELNPPLRHNILNSSRRLPKGLQLRIPWRENFNQLDFLAHIPSSEKQVEQIETHWYKVEPGDNLKKIAKKFNTNVDDIIASNDDIDDIHKIYVNQIIRLSGREEISDRTKEKIMLAVNQTLVQDAEYSPVVEAKPEPETEKQIDLEAKVIPRTEKTVPSIQGQSDVDRIVVSPDETLGHYADWLKIPTQRLRDLNGFGYQQDIQLGQIIQIIYENVSMEHFQQRRMEYHHVIEEDFFNNYKVEGVVKHKIRSGENIWYLCQEVYEVPYWLIVKYNPDMDFKILKKDDEIIVPVIKLNNNS